MATFISDHPSLRQFLLSGATSTGKKVSLGSYGNAEEVAIPGAVCVAKHVHEFFQGSSRISTDALSREIARECELISTLRHPHIVQFLGVCFLPDSRLPALVTEKLVTTLHDILEPELPPPPPRFDVPDSLKFSILHDVACGLAYLHGHKPPIIDCHLSARNVLLNSGMVAKIADLGVARIATSLKVQTVTSAPGALVYMPPEAIQDDVKPSVKMDMFSFGVLSLFTLSQAFPKPLLPTYVDKSGKILGRTELERRGSYMQLVVNQFRQEHPLVNMVTQCLKNLPTDRPTIQRVVGWLEQAKATVQELDVSKLSLAQLVQSKDAEIDQQRETIKAQKKQLDEKSEQIENQKDHIRTLEEQNQFLKEENAALKATSLAATAILPNPGPRLVPTVRAA